MRTNAKKDRSTSPKHLVLLWLKLADTVMLLIKYNFKKWNIWTIRFRITHYWIFSWTNSLTCLSRVLMILTRVKTQSCDTSIIELTGRYKRKKTKNVITIESFLKNTRRSIWSNARSTYDGIHRGKLSHAGNWHGHVGIGSFSSSIGYHFNRSANVFTQVFF